MEHTEKTDQRFVAHIDYITLTSYEKSSWVLFRDIQSKCTETREKKVAQYMGEIGKVRHGSIFVGSGVQGAKVHNMMQVSGNEAHHLFYTDDRLSEGIKAGWLRVTRIDIQSTLEWGRGAYEWLRGIENRIKDRGDVCTWEESQHDKWGKLATCYIGSKRSDRFFRVYMKPTMDAMRIRYELQVGGATARSIGKQIANGASHEGFIKWSAKKVKDEGFDPLMEVLDGVGAERVSREIDEDRKTRDWLMRMLVAFSRYITSDDADPLVADSYYSVLLAHYRQDGL